MFLDLMRGTVPNAHVTEFPDARHSIHNTGMEAFVAKLFDIMESAAATTPAAAAGAHKIEAPQKIS